MPTTRLPIRDISQFKSIRHYLFLLFIFLISHTPVAAKEKEYSHNAVVLKNDSVNSAKKNELFTGAVSEIKNDVIEKTSFNNVKNSLSGYVNGLYVNQSGGEPGAEWSTLSIRGKRTTENGNNSPYILVDGYERDMNYLDANEVESITVLKDAVSTAKYGLKGASGVLLVKTKRGSNSGSTRITFDSQITFKQALNIPNPVGAVDYMKYYNIARVNDGNLPSYNQQLIDSYGNSTDKYLYPDVNWLGEFFNKDSYKQHYSLGIDGGNSFAKYYVALSYLDDIGNINIDPSANKYSTQNKQNKYSIRSNIDVQVTKQLKLAANIWALYSFINKPNNQSGSSVYKTLLNYLPNAHPIMNENGSVAGNQQYSSNPYAIINKGGYGENFNRYVTANIDLTYNLDFITLGLSTSGSLAFDNNYIYNVTRTKSYANYEWTKDVNGNPMYETNGGKIYKQWGNNSSLILSGTSGTYYRRLNVETGLTYKRQFEKNLISAHVNAYNYDYQTDAVLPHAMAGIDGSFGYSYNSRYLLDLSGCWSGTEQFPTNNRMHLFSAAGLGWVVSNESFMNNNNIVSFLKVRASYGTTGSDVLSNGSTDIYYDYLGSFQKGGTTFFGEGNPLSITGSGIYSTGYLEGGVANPELKPEKTTKANLGIDFRFLNNALSLSANYFDEYTSNILAIRQSIPYMMGIPSGKLMVENIGEIRNQGAEIEIGLQHSIGKLKLFIQGNATYAKNKIIYLDEESGLAEPRTGYPIDAYWGFRSLGYFQTDAEIASSPSQQTVGKTAPGDLKFADMNGDNVINEYDRVYLGKVGTPDWFYGINLGVKYKGFEFSSLIQGVSGLNKVYRDGINTAFGNKGNMYDFQVDNFWTAANSSNATFPRLTIDGSSSSKAKSDFWLKDASYIRLKNVELSYIFSTKWILKDASIRVYLSGSNLLSINKLSSPIDPEISSDGQSYPINRMFTLGFRLNI